MRRTSISARTDSKRDAKKAAPFNPKAQKHHQSLKAFSCPLCLATGALMINMTVCRGAGAAVFTCVECKKEGRTGAGSIQFPYKMSFTPKLQKKVDVFFKFRDFVMECGLGGAAAHGAQQPNVAGEQRGLDPTLGILGNALAVKDTNDVPALASSAAAPYIEGSDDGEELLSESSDDGDAPQVATASSSNGPPTNVDGAGEQLEEDDDLDALFGGGDSSGDDGGA